MKFHLLVLIFWILVYPITAQNLSKKSIAELDSLFDVQKSKQAYEKLMPIAQARFDKTSKEYPKEDTIHAYSLYLMGYAIDYGLEDFEKAIDYYKQAIDIQKKKSPNSKKLLKALNSLFDIYYNNLHQYEKAISTHIESIHIAEKIYGKEHDEHFYRFIDLGFLYLMVGNYALSEKTYKEGVVLAQKISGTESERYGFAINQLALLYVDIANYAEAEKLYLKSKAIHERVFGKESPKTANLLDNLAGLYESLERYSEAEPLYLEAVNIRKKILGEMSPDYARSLNNLGILYLYMARPADAEPLLNEALKIQKEVLGEKNDEYATTVNNLAGLYRDLDDYKKSELMYLEFKKIIETTLGKNNTNYAAAANNLGSVYRYTGEYKKAEALYTESLNIRKEIFGTTHPSFLESLYNLAVLYKVMNQDNRSWELSQNLLNYNLDENISLNINELWKDSLSKAHCFSVKYMIYALQNIYDLLGKQATASSTQKQVIVSELAMLLLKRRRDTYLGDSDKLRNLSDNIRWTLRGLQVLNPEKEIDKAFYFAEQSKSVLLLESMQNTQASMFGNLPDSLVKKENELSSKQSELEASLQEKLPTDVKHKLRSELNDLNLSINDFKEKIEKEYPQYAQIKYKQKTASTEEVQKLLPTNTALIEFVLGDSSVYIFYLDKQQKFLLTNKITKEELAKKAKLLHTSLSDYVFITKEENKVYQQFTSNAHWFYTQLLQSVLNKANGIENLVIISDGDLAHLPFETFLVELPTNQDKKYNNLHYLLQDYNIYYNYSATLFAELQKISTSKNTSGQMLAMAANYKAIEKNFVKGNYTRSPVHINMRNALIPLPSARQEVEELSQQFSGHFAFDKLASEKEFKQKAKEFSIIHLAMHGLLDQKNPILSSLAFTEDEDSLENNFLQAFEISKMQLNADLVVLSACETGFGKFEQGNGTASLARAFMYAGAPSLVVSLWQVNDHSTAIIMQNFYKYLSENKTTAEALRQAKLDYLKLAEGIAAHPAFWSAFIQLGDNQTVYMKPKSNWIWWLVGGLAFVGIGALVWSKRNK